MSSLPLFKTGNVQVDLLQTKWKAELDPVLSNLLVQGRQINNITLNPGTNSINHLLGRAQLGWTLADINGNASVWRSAPFNSTVLTLTSSASSPITISLWVW